MFNAERRQLILERLHREGRIVAAELSAELGVCEDTIRRDLRSLAEEGLVQRVHGGALFNSSTAASEAVQPQRAATAKQQIAQTAAGLAQHGQIIFLDGGAASLMAARSFSRDLRATVVTNNLLAAVALKNHPHIDIMFVGGQVRKESLTTLGAIATDAFRKIRADLCFLSACCLHPYAGLTIANVEEAYVRQAMIEHSAEVVALVSPEQLNATEPYVIAPLHKITCLITERDVPDTAFTQYRTCGVTVLLA